MKPNQDKTTERSTAIHWICIAILAMQLPFVVRHLMNLWRFRPHYEFFPVVLIACGWLIWTRWPKQLEIPKRTPRLAIGMFALGMSLMLVALAFVSPWLATVAFLINTGAVIVRLTGRGARDLVAPWLLLWLIVPPPFAMDAELIKWMQQFTAESVSAMLEWKGIDHLLTGSVFQLSGQRLFVAEACSGIHSQLLLIAASLVIAIVQRRSWGGTFVLVIASVIWSVIANTARVMTVAYTAAKYDIDLSTGWTHELLGFGLLMVGLALVLSTDQFFLGVRLAFENPDEAITGSEYMAEEAKVHPETDNTPKLNLADRVLSLCVASDAGSDSSARTNSPGIPGFLSGMKLVTSLSVIVGVMGLLQVAVIASERTEVRITGITNQLPEKTLPNQIGEWDFVQYAEKTRERGSDEGEYSQIWRYASAEAAVQLSVDYPFFGWHELVDCYTARGWTITNQQIVRKPIDSDGVACGDFVEVELMGPSGEYGYLVFSLFDVRGNVIAEQKDYWQNRVAFSPIVTVVRGRPTQSIDETTTQIQLFAISESPLSDEVKQAVNSLFTTARSLVTETAIKRGNNHG